MKILHTADWHLGQRFLHHDRADEHREMLAWLHQTIVAHGVELLLIAGDIFDVSNPPNYAREQYYQFLTELRHTSCRHIVVIGGNHDSPAMLNAPRSLLEILRIHVVGCISESVNDELIVLKNEEEEVELVVAAVPFLREQDIRFSIAGQSYEERLEAIREGIYAHYDAVAQAAQKLAITQKVPLIATGHLYAIGGTRDASRLNRIYMGLIDHVRADKLPEVFDYIALGHLHRPQIPDSKLPHIRYAGSPIPLSFTEIDHSKKVCLLEFEGKVLKEIQEVRIPTFRKLLRIEGTLEGIQKKLTELDGTGTYTTWAEVIVQTDRALPDLDGTLRDFVKGLAVELLKIRTSATFRSLDEQVVVEDLDDLSPIEVFRKKCASQGHEPEEMETLEQSFKELLEWMEGKAL